MVVPSSGRRVGLRSTKRILLSEELERGTGFRAPFFMPTGSEKAVLSCQHALDAADSCLRTLLICRMGS